jgi:hypothetical protein
VRNEPNLARPDGKCAKRTQFRPGGVADGANRVKQSQTWVDWAMWAMADVSAVARPGSETCKTNPICLPGQMVGTAHPTEGAGPVRPRNAQNEPNLAPTGSGTRGERRKTNPIWSTSHFKLPARHPHGRDYVQNEPNLVRPRADARDELCKTNPISPRRRRPTDGTVQNEAKLGVAGVHGKRQLSCGPTPAGG